MTTKKRGTGSNDDKPTKTRSDEARGKIPKRAAPSSGSARPRLRASHAVVPPIAASGLDDDDDNTTKSSSGDDDSVEPARKRAPSRSGGALGVKGARRAKVGVADEARPRRRASAEGGALPVSSSRKTPLGVPKRQASRRAAPSPSAGVTHEASSYAREVAMAVAVEGIEKKAVGIEILDVTGKIDYADFLVIMTGRSDRHVQAIASGLEEAMRKKKIAPLSMEGLTSATWVLIDFGDVVVHVFQEDARRVYDIEGLWIDAGRVPVPSSEAPGGGSAGA